MALGDKTGNGMTAGNALGGGAKVAIAAVGLVGAVLLGSYLWAPGADNQVEKAANDQVAPASTAAPAPEPTAAASATDELPEVTVGNWRVEADGAGLISGKAAKDAKISVLVDGVQVASGTAMGSGDFVVLFTLSPNDKPSLMTVEAELADGTKLDSPAAIALAAIPGVAMTEPAEPEQEPAAEVAVADGDVADTAVEAAAEATAEPERTAMSEPAPVAVLVTDEGAKVVQGDAASAPESGEAATVVVSAIAYTASGAVQISGSGSPNAFVRLYLDNVLAAEVPVLPDSSWQTVLEDAAPGLYTLRVDQVDAAGKVTARFETPFKRETVEALAALSSGAETAAATPAEPEASAAIVEPAPEAQQTVAESSGEEPATAAETTPEPAPTAPETAAAETVVAEQAPSEPAPTEGVTEPPQADTAAPEAISPAPSTPAPVAVAAETQAPAAEAPTATPAAPTAEAPPAPAPQTVSITVQPGYSLWKIARDTYGEGVMYVEVYEANKEKIRNPDLIYPGQVFEIPAQ